MSGRRPPPPSASPEDNVIPFPGTAAGAPPPTGERLSPPGSGTLGLPGLSADQEKALGMILDGTFVCVGVRPTCTGADFLVAMDGRRQDLADAAPHLPDILRRALADRGL
jgi:hypothetical protein